jgi:hypothetical protein
MRRSSPWNGLLCALPLALISCDRTDTPAELAASAPAPTSQADERLLLAREADKLADDVAYALSERWPGLAEVVSSSARPLVSLADILAERGLPDLQDGLPTGVYDAYGTQQRYFAAVLLGGTSEIAGLKVAARLEAQRLTSLHGARAALPSVEQRLSLDRLARSSSERLQGLCQRLSELGASCLEGLFEPELLATRSELTPLHSAP